MRTKAGSVATIEERARHLAEQRRFSDDFGRAASAARRGLIGLLLVFMISFAAGVLVASFVNGCDRPRAPATTTAPEGSLRIVAPSNGGG